MTIFASAYALVCPHRHEPIFARKVRVHFALLSALLSPHILRCLPKAARNSITLARNLSFYNAICIGISLNLWWLHSTNHLFYPRHTRARARVRLLSPASSPPLSLSSLPHTLTPFKLPFPRLLRDIYIRKWLHLRQPADQGYQIRWWRLWRL